MCDNQPTKPKPNNKMTQEKENIYYLPSGNGVCVKECPTETNYTQFICYDEVYPEIYSNDTGEV